MTQKPKDQEIKRPPEIPLRPGSGLHLGRNPLGTWMSAAGGGGNFSHPFTVMGSGEAVMVSRGLILDAGSAVEPRIGDIPLGGDKQHAAPTLQLDPARRNEQGESWVCVEVTPTEEGKLDAEKVVVVQRAAPFIMAGETGRAPLALLLYEDDRAFPQIWQIAMFHYRYETVQPAEGKRRHFFT